MDTLLFKLPCTALFANFFLAVLLHTSVAPAQNLPGTRRPELPDASGRTAIAEHSYPCNPALFADIESAVASAVVTPSRLGMPELAYGEVLACWRNGGAAYGFAAGGTGTPLYNELSATGFFALTPTQDFAAGIGASLLRLGIRDAPARTALYITLGARLHITPDVTAGMALHNSTRAGFGEDSPIDQAALLSAGATVTPDVAASAGVLVRPGTSSALLLSGLYNAFATVRLRLALQTFPRSAESGFAISLDAFTITGSLHYHSDLGFSQTLGCVYRW